MLLLTRIFGSNILHEPVLEAQFGIPCPVEATLDIAESEVHRFSLLFRPIQNEEYVEVPMILIGNKKYFGEIPAEFMRREKLEYYLLLELPGQKESTYPIDNAVNNPLYININGLITDNSMKVTDFDIIGVSPKVVILSPQPGESVKQKDLYIALSYFSMKDVDLSRIKIYIDDIDMSARAEIDSF